jgi:hypothetical protein
MVIRPEPAGLVLPYRSEREGSAGIEFVYGVKLFAAEAKTS